MSTHNIGFYEDLTKNIFQLSSNIIKYTSYFFFCIVVSVIMPKHRFSREAIQINGPLAWSLSLGFEQCTIISVLTFVTLMLLKCNMRILISKCKLQCGWWKPAQEINAPTHLRGILGLKTFHFSLPWYISPTLWGHPDGYAALF